MNSKLNNRSFYVVARDGGIRELTCNHIQKKIFKTNDELQEFRKEYPESKMIEIDPDENIVHDHGINSRIFVCAVYRIMGSDENNHGIYINTYQMN